MVGYAGADTAGSRSLPQSSLLQGWVKLRGTDHLTFLPEFATPMEDRWRKLAVGTAMSCQVVRRIAPVKAGESHAKAKLSNQVARDSALDELRLPHCVLAHNYLPQPDAKVGSRTALPKNAPTSKRATLANMDRLTAGFP